VVIIIIIIIIPAKLELLNKLQSKSLHFYRLQHS